MSELTQEYLHELFDFDPLTGNLIWKVHKSARVPAGRIAGSISKNAYYKIIIDGKTYQAHRLVWLYVYGKLPDKHLDHINGNGKDNRIENLRECNDSTNQMNKKLNSNTTSGLKGVSKHKSGKWLAQIKADGKRIQIGFFSDKHDAHAAYVKVAKEKFGEFFCDGNRS